MADKNIQYFLNIAENAIEYAKILLQEQELQSPQVLKNELEMVWVKFEDKFPTIEGIYTEK